jgi:hypothetical protein
VGFIFLRGEEGVINWRGAIRLKQSQAAGERSSHERHKFYEKREREER